MIQSEGLYLADCHWSASGNCAIDLCQMVTLCQWCSNGYWAFARLISLALPQIFQEAACSLIQCKIYILSARALGDRPPPPPPFSKTNFQTQSFIEFVILGACGFSCSHHHMQAQQLFTTSSIFCSLMSILYLQLISCPTFSYLTMLLPSSSPKRRRIESRTSSFSQWSTIIFMGGLFQLWWAPFPNTSKPLPHGVKVCVRFWSRWRSAPTWFQCCSISSYH